MMKNDKEKIMTTYDKTVDFNRSLKIKQKVVENLCSVFSELKHWRFI